MFVTRVNTRINKHWILLILFLGGAARLFGGTYYVLAGGSGNHTGSDWSNANCKIPATLNPGDVIYIGNSGGNLADATTPCAGELTHIFSTSGTSGSHITIKAATGADHGTATGWSAGYGVDVTPKVTWSNNFVPADGLKQPFLKVCGDYIDVDGQVGSADTTGTYGFYFRSAGRMWASILSQTNQCGSHSRTNLTIKHVEIDGVNPDSTAGGTNAGAAGMYFGATLVTDTVQNISVSNSYIHDIFGMINSTGNLIGFTLDHSWLERNFSCGAYPYACNQHSNAVDTQSPSGDNTSIGIKNLDVHDTVFEDIQGTGLVMCLGGTCDGWKIYNNIAYYSSTWDTTCYHGNTAANCDTSVAYGDNGTTSPYVGNITNGVFYGNTFANFHHVSSYYTTSTASIQAHVNGSTGNDAQNNLWWNCEQAIISGGSNITHDYNTWLNTAHSGGILNTHEFQIGTAPGGAAINPFVNQYGDFHLTSETVDTHLNDGDVLASPYNLDFSSITRGADGTWERGAYEFNVGGSNPNPPTNLQATPH